MPAIPLDHKKWSSFLTIFHLITCTCQKKAVSLRSLLKFIVMTA